MVTLTAREMQEVVGCATDHAENESDSLENISPVFDFFRGTFFSEQFKLTKPRSASCNNY